MNNQLISIKNLVKYFPIKKGVFRTTVGWVKAVDDVSFDIYSGETLGLVGESGCGKSTTAMTILRLEEPTGGDIIYQGKNLAKISKNNMRKYRKDLQIIFQDPYSSLDPRMKIKDIIAEGLAAHHMLNTKKRYQKVAEILQRVGIVPEYMWNASMNSVVGRGKESELRAL